MEFIKMASGTIQRVKIVDLKDFNEMFLWKIKAQKNRVIAVVHKKI